MSTLSGEVFYLGASQFLREIAVICSGRRDDGPADKDDERKPHQCAENKCAEKKCDTERCDNRQRHRLLNLDGVRSSHCSNSLLAGVGLDFDWTWSAHPAVSVDIQTVPSPAFGRKSPLQPK